MHKGKERGNWFSFLVSLVITVIVALLVSKCLFTEEPVDTLEQESGRKVLSYVGTGNGYGSIELRWHLENGKIVLDKSGYLTQYLRRKLEAIDYHPAVVRLEHVGLWPVPGRNYISSGFGIRKKRLHSGIDIPARGGTPVIAAYPGIVIFAKWSRSGYGKLVVTVDKEAGYIIFYGHLSRIAVEEGDYVKTGQFIGRVGNTGRSYGPHLHFEVRTSLETPIDPLVFLEHPTGLIINTKWSRK